MGLGWRRRRRSPAKSTSPLMNRNTAAATGLAKMVRKVCSRAIPVSPTGMVAITIIQARRSSRPSTVTPRWRRLRVTLRTKPRMMRTQSARKYQRRASAVAQCRATM